MIPTPFTRFRANRIVGMRPTQKLFNAAKKPGLKLPVELTPLFLAMGIAVASAIYFSAKHLTSGDLRVGRKNPDHSNLQKVLDENK